MADGWSGDVGESMSLETRSIPVPGFDVDDDGSFSESPNVQYGIVASGPPVNPSEVEGSALAAEVMVLWGERSVLQVTHLSPLRSFWVGESASKETPVDFLLGSDLVGTARFPLLRVVEGEGSKESGRGPQAVVVVLPGMSLQATGRDGVSASLQDLGAENRLQPVADLPGALQFPLVPGTTAEVELRGFTFVIKIVPVGRRIVAGGPQDKRPFWYTAASILLHLLFLLMFYFLPPRPSSLAFDVLNTESRLIKYMMDPEEQERLKAVAQGDAGGADGKKAEGESGESGEQTKPKTKNRRAIKGPSDNADPAVARAEAKEQAKTAGILGVLSAGQWDSSSSPYGKTAALGSDPMSALGAMLGSQVGENFGFGGLGMRSAGRGGGGDGQGTIGTGSFGTIGRGAGGGDGDYGKGKGNLSGRKGGLPTIRAGVADVRGTLSKDVIRRVIRRHINEVRFCYEQELNQRPDLEGRVTVSFIISPTGAVQSSTVVESTLGSQPVELCIASSVRRWSFPSPDGGGIVVVNYPFLLSAAGE